MSTSIFNDPEMQEIFEAFLIETQELLDNISRDLMQIEQQPDDMELVNRLFRSFHTIKGTSSFMGFDSITDITHHAEDLLNKMRRSEILISLPIIDILLEVHDWINLLMEKILNGNMENVDYSATIAEIEKYKNPIPVVSQDVSKNLEISMTETHDLSENEVTVQPEVLSTETEIIVTDKLPDEDDYLSEAIEEAVFDDIENISENDNQINSKSALDSILNNPDITSKPGDFTPEELDLIQAAFAEVNAGFLKSEAKFDNEFSKTTEQFIEEHKDILIDDDESEIIQQAIKEKEKINEKGLPEKSKHIEKEQTQSSKIKTTSETIRVDVQRVESLMNLSGELVLGRNRLAQITESLEQESENKNRVRELIETTSQIDFVTSEIQAAVMRMRMVPIGKLYLKAPRMVRDLSKEFGKTINLIIKGEETEIDRGIIEELNDPLVHMIRNSCDHGIETKEERIKFNKSPEGTTTLDALQEGNAIVLKISDDGKGMDPEKIKAKAIEKGIISEDIAQQLSKRDIFQMIFLPGFSTAAKVSNVSGRGVGMDVVRTNIQNLKGMIDIESEIGTGTTFIIKLPLTIAIIKGLLIKLKNETYALPLSSVVEVVAVDIKNVFSVNQQQVIRIREDVLPLIRLDKALGLKNLDHDLNKHYVVVVGLGMQRIGFVVDELLGQQEIVIKSLGEFLGQVKGIAGSTILGDGRVIMIVDVADLVQSSYSSDFMKLKAL